MSVTRRAGQVTALAGQANTIGGIRTASHAHTGTGRASSRIVYAASRLLRRFTGDV